MSRPASDSGGGGVASWPGDARLHAEVKARQLKVEKSAMPAKTGPQIEARSAQFPYDPRGYEPEMGWMPLYPTASRCAKLVSYVAPQGIGHLRRLEEVIEDDQSELPPLARDICRLLLEQITGLTARIDALKKTIDAMSREAATSRRLQTMPGVGCACRHSLQSASCLTSSIYHVEITHVS